jgi:hypothetical protein
MTYWLRGDTANDSFCPLFEPPPRRAAVRRSQDPAAPVHSLGSPVSRALRAVALPTEQSCEENIRMTGSNPTTKPLRGNGAGSPPKRSRAAGGSIGWKADHA